MTSSSELPPPRPSVRLALAEARAQRLDPASPSAVKREASMPSVFAAAGGATKQGDGGGDFFVAPVAIAIDRTGGHAAMREDILLPLDGKEEHSGFSQIVSFPEKQGRLRRHSRVSNSSSSPLFLTSLSLSFSTSTSTPFHLQKTVSDEAASRLALKLCQETGMEPASAEAITEQVLEYLAPFREEDDGGEEGGGVKGDGEGAPPRPATSGRGVRIPRPRTSSSSSSPSPRVVELELDAHCDGLRVQDRLLWDLGVPAPLTAAWAAETARDLGLSSEGCRALREELEAAVARAKRRGKESEPAKTIKLDPEAASWMPRVADDSGGWGDA